jgi:NADH-quinone oxidoreductase subunit J
MIGLTESLLMSPFFWLALMCGLFAVATVATKHILRSAISLMAVLLLSAGLYLLLGAEFLAGVQVLVYVGGVVVLLVFAVMLTKTEALNEDRPSLTRKALGFFSAASFFTVSAWAMNDVPVMSATIENTPLAGVKEIGRAFLDYTASGYVLPFEVISLLLLAVLIAGIVLARKDGLTDEPAKELK